MIKFSCSECGQAYRVSGEYAGKSVRCKRCRQINTIPQHEKDGLGSGNSLIAYDNLLRELAEDEKTAPALERDA